MTITIFYTRFDHQLTESKYHELLNLLPTEQKERNQRFVRWQDRHSHLCGRLLLKAGLEMHGFSSNCLSDLHYSNYDRPYINDKIDFNISHSGNYIVCAIGQGLKLGIDIEKVQDIDFKDFKKVMSVQQWQDINNSKCPIRAFFKYWTIKESVIKADSRGLSIPLLNIHVDNDIVNHDSQTWYLNELHIDKDYCACLAKDVENVEISFNYIDFNSEQGEESKQKGIWKTEKGNPDTNFPVTIDQLTKV